MPKKQTGLSDPSSEDKTPTSAIQVEGGIEYFFPRHQITIVADSLEDAQKELEKRLAKDGKK